jgi:hypothetical protein
MVLEEVYPRVVAEMAVKVTSAEYFSQYLGDPSVTMHMVANAADLLARVNAIYEYAKADGCEMPDNPDTQSGVSGQGHGGYRAPNCTVGATNSTHRNAQVIDRYDPSRKFASWCMAHQNLLRDHGLYMEDPRWTKTWVHLQSVPPKSGNRVYIPSTEVALAGDPQPWGTYA